MKKTAWILSFLIPFQWLFLNRIKNHPDWIELYYSQKIYPLIFDSQRLFFQHVPISLGDIIYAVLLILVIWSLIQLIQKKLKLKKLARKNTEYMQALLMTLNHYKNHLMI